MAEPAGPPHEEEGLRSSGRWSVGAEESVRASRRGWDADADKYQAEHGGFLGDARFVWCPEGLDEADARLLGDVTGATVLEVGCGAAQCSRWLSDQGARVIGVDLSGRQLQHSRRIDAALGCHVPVAQADARALPVASAAVDLAFSAFGALPFVADVEAVLAELHRVVRPGGRWVFSVSHPVRWAFPDDPGPGGLTADRSYFDRTPYVERDDAGNPSYVEHHRTVGDWIRACAATRWRLVDLIEPEWPEGHHRAWGQWSPLRGRYLPGTAILVTQRLN